MEANAEEKKEEIKSQLADTKASLTDKLETLERKVASTVESATSAVEGVKEAASNAVEGVKEAAHQTVETVKSAFDFNLQMQEHPWAMLAGAAALGFVSACALTKKTSHIAAKMSEASQTPTNGHSNSDYGMHSISQFADVPRSAGSSAHENRTGSSSFSGGILGKVGEMFHDEIDQIKSLAIGALGGVARDMLRGAVSGSLESKVVEIIDGVTKKLGGEPMRGGFNFASMGAKREASRDADETDEPISPVPGARYS